MRTGLLTSDLVFAIQECHCEPAVSNPGRAYVLTRKFLGSSESSTVVREGPCQLAI
jgi:hypothetical protein